MNKQLKTPVQHGYSADNWKKAFNQIDNPSDDDLILFKAAIFFGDQLNGLRTILRNYPPPSGTVEQKIQRAIGYINREYLTAININIYQDDNNSTILANQEIEKQINLAGGINSATLSDLIESIVDGLRLELQVLISNHDSTQCLNSHDIDPLQLIAKRGNFSTFYNYLEEQWLECLNLGYKVITEGDLALLIPNKSIRFAYDWAIGYYRDQALLLEFTGRYMQALKSGIQVEKIKGVRKKSLANNGFYCDYASEEVAHRIQINKLLATEQELAPYFDKKLNFLNGLSTREMIQVWSALACLADDYSSDFKDKTEPLSLTELEKLCPIITVNDVLGPLIESTGLTKKKCLEALNNLSWRNVRDSLWNRPLVPRNNQKKFLVTLPALYLPNLRRSVEYWLAEEGGIELSLRGNHFEKQVRISLENSIKKNPILKNTGIFKKPVRPNNTSIGDIDLLVWIKNTILVGEVKCLLRPATSHERFQFDSRIKEGAIQANKKSNYVEQNIEWLLSILEDNNKLIKSEPIRVISCVVVNTNIGALRLINNIPIVDQYILERYFEYGYGRMFAYLENEENSPKLEFYKTEDEAAELLKKYLEDPPHLSIYRKNIKHKKIYLPSFSEDYKSIVNVIPVVQIIPDSKS
ncbi:MAG: hypothetical protein KDC97_12690 [Confluentibacter sp.]|nr:hypothetical protein [Confluentibacter sp.]